MRQLDPKVVQDRKRKLLQWVIHSYIKTSRPIASSDVAQEAGMALSSASIRNILQELEEEGFLHQPHTSAGRVPTDKGYRFYVDYITGVQRLAADEKERLEREYSRRTAQIDQLLSETSRLLSHASRSAGLVLSPKMEKQNLKRLELIPIGARQVLAIVVTQSGLIRHWPIQLSFEPTASRVNMLNRFLNDNIQGKSIREVQRTVEARVEEAARELHELGGMAKKLLDEMALIAGPRELYLDGATNILAHTEDFGDVREIQQLIHVIEEKDALADMLGGALDEGIDAKGGRPVVRVLIGRENSRKELSNLSLVTSTYRLRGQVVGALGILGSKRMEYSRMMALVDYMGDVVSKALENWERGTEEGDEPKRRK